MYDELVKRLREDAEDGYLIQTRPGDDIAEAADAIEELQKLLDGVSADNDNLCKQLDSMNDANIAVYGALPKWIPVTDGVPSAEKEVYVTDGEYIARAILLDEVFPGDKPCWSCSGLGEITHWCEQIPLPQPPKEE